MGCKACQGKRRKRGVCDVHELVDGDSSERLVKWCELCKAWVCDNCKSDLTRRAQAATIRATRNIGSAAKKLFG